MKKESLNAKVKRLERQVKVYKDFANQKQVERNRATNFANEKVKLAEEYMKSASGMIDLLIRKLGLTEVFISNEEMQNHDRVLGTFEIKEDGILFKVGETNEIHNTDRTEDEEE